MITVLLISTFCFADGIETNNPESNKGNVHGKVIDKKTGEALAGVKLFIEETNQAVYSDLDGNFVIKDVKSGNYNIRVSYISYQENQLTDVKLDPYKSKTLEINLD